MVGGRVLWLATVGALVAGLMCVPSAPAGAVEIPFHACPAEAASWGGPITAYPPYPEPGTDSATGLVDCDSPFAPTVEGQNATTSYEFSEMPTDECHTIESVWVTSTGSPGGAGWGVLAYNVDDPTVHYTGPAGTGDGMAHQYGLQTGDTFPFIGVLWYSPSDQPVDGEYSVTYELDPEQLDLATLAAGQLGVAAVVISVDDVLTSLEVDVVLDDGACPQPTSPTTASTTTTSAPAAEPAATTRPRFTG